MGYAVDRQMRKLADAGRILSVWSGLESVDPKYYDYLAAMLRSPYYSSAYDNATKLKILQGVLKTHMFAGSARAVRDLLRDILIEAEFVPWYEYGGEPFHFKIVVPTDPSAETLQKFAEILEKVKSARSVIDALETKQYSYDLDVYIRTGVWQCERLEG